MMKKVLSVYLLYLIPFAGMAQARFILSGKIEFERKINVARLMGNSEFEQIVLKEFQSKYSNFAVSNFSLLFDSVTTLYQPLSTAIEGYYAYLTGPAKDNTVYTELDKGVVVSQKQIFENSYLVKDSVKVINWKISDEQRTIAGFECRKAVGVIFDSVYVVAFYTEEIPVSGGPESFSGLPGMILGLAIPRLHTTWFATRLVLTEPDKRELRINKKGRETSRKELEVKLNASPGEWMGEKQRNIWWSLL